MTFKSVSAYPAVGPEVRLAGGTYAEIGMYGARRRQAGDGAWPAHPAWLARFLDVLGAKIEP